MASFINLIDKDKLQIIINESTSIAEVLRKLDKRPAGANYNKLISYLKEHPDINTQTLVGRRIQRYNKKGVPLKNLSEVLIENSTGNSFKLKSRLFREGIKEQKCEYCGKSEWMGETIPLDLHHINGNHFDNRLENLIILCPNCHRLTDNWGSKNSSIDLIFKQIAEQTSEDKMKLLLEKEEKRTEEIRQNKIKYGKIKKNLPKKKVIRYCKYCGKEITNKGRIYCSDECYKKDVTKNIPSKDELLSKSFEFKSLEQMARFYKVSGNGCKKWLKKYEIYDDVKNNFKNDYSVIQLTLDGELIREWNSVSEIEKTLGFKKGNIQKACKGYRKTSNGYIWKYKNKLN